MHTRVAMFFAALGLLASRTSIAESRAAPAAQRLSPDIAKSALACEPQPLACEGILTATVWEVRDGKTVPLPPLSQRGPLARPNKEKVRLVTAREAKKLAVPATLDIVFERITQTRWKVRITAQAHDVAPDEIAAIACGESVFVIERSGRTWACLPK